MILVDTGAWFALLVDRDPLHLRALAWMDANFEGLALTDYILDETLTLLRAKAERSQALRFGREILEEHAAELLYLKAEEIEAAWDVFRTYHDKEWSFTDCTSKVLMEARGIQTAFAFDQHFRQFGSVTVVP
jgi:predicted nucleic acid-binding protein